jgi:hypothetical protein
LAQQAWAKNNPLPGAGEGTGEHAYAPAQKDYLQGVDANGLPKGPPGSGITFPPPVRPEHAQLEPESFGGQAQEALDEQYPQRPVMNNPMYSAEKTAENPVPQEMLTRAPDEVDTLRDEQICPVCGSDMDDETCKVCGYVAPPAEFDNPDLTKAEGIRDQMAEADQQQVEQEGKPMNPLDQGGQQPGAPPNPVQRLQQGGPLTGRQPGKVPVAAGVTNDMRWTPQVHPVTAARINQTEQPVRPTNRPTSNEPSSETVVSDQTQPVTSAMLTARQLMAAAQRTTTNGDTMHNRTADGPTPPGDTSPKTRVDVTGVGGVDEASNEAASKSDAQVDVTGVGSTGTQEVSADKTESLPTAGEKSDDAGFNTDKSTEDSGPTKTFGDSDGTEKGVTDPVTSDPFPASEDGVKSSGQRRAYEDGTLEQQEQQGDPVAQGGSAVQGVQPIDSVATDSYQRVNLLEHKTSPSNNSGETSTWTGTDGNGVLKQQEPVTSELPASGGVTYPDVKLHTTSVDQVVARVITAARLAETEIELGLPGRTVEAKWNRVEELVYADQTKVAAQLDTLTQVKTAGLQRLAARKTASAFPRSFGRATAAGRDFERIASDTTKEASTEDQTFHDSALFG